MPLYVCMEQILFYVTLIKKIAQLLYIYIFGKMAYPDNVYVTMYDFVRRFYTILADIKLEKEILLRSEHEKRMMEVEEMID